MERCRHCADIIRPASNGVGWDAVFPCITGHVHEPWPDLLYVEQEEMPGVSIMRLVGSQPNLN